MSTASVKHHSVDRRFVAIGAVVLFLLSTLLLIVPQEDADASMSVIESSEVVAENGWSQVIYDSDGTKLCDVTVVNKSNANQCELRIVLDNTRPTSGMFTQHSMVYHTSWGDDNGYAHAAQKYNDFDDGEELDFFGVTIPSAQFSDVEYIHMEFYIGDGESGSAPTSQTVSFRFTLEPVTVYRYTTSATFDPNGGSGTPAKLTDTSDRDSVSTETVDLGKPSLQPTNGDLIFKGWATSKGGSVVYGPDENITVQIGTEVQLYAVWDIPSHTVTFLRSEGDVIDSVSVKNGDTVPVPEEPDAPDGFFFVGWYTDNTHSTAFDFSEPVTADTYVYAYFQEELCFTSEPQALYTVTKISGVQNTYVFQVLEESCSTSVHWDFDDGNTSDERFVSHYFDEPGTYSVSLTVYNNHGEATETFDVVVPAEDDGESDVLLYIAVGLIAIVIAAVVATKIL